jgi:hypothetical protein
MSLETGMPAVTVNELSADQWRPISRVLQIDRSFLSDLQGIHQPAFEPPEPGEGPPLDSVPTSVDSFWTSGPEEYFVPAVEIAKRSPTSAVPAVFVDRVQGGWSLRIVLNFRRHPYFGPDQGAPLAIGDLSVRLYCPLESGGEDSVTITDLTEQTPLEPGVIRRVVARTPIIRAWVDRMSTVPGTVLLVTGVPQFSRSAQLEQQIQEQGWGGDPATVMLTVEPEGANLFFPGNEAAYAPIYGQIDGTGGGEWVLGPGGAWQAAPVANQFYALPTEYRLAFDVEHAQPAVTVLLLEPPPSAPNGPGAAYRVRIRFKLVPWFDPELVEQLRQDICDTTGVAYPDLVVGGYQSAEFATSTLFNDLGGTVLGQGPATTTVDGRGFELVFDCSMEFYTLICGLLAPATGAPTGLEGRVRFTLTAAADGAAPAMVRDIPVRIRLDLPTDDFLTFEQVPVPDPATWPPGWIPPVYARVRNRANGDAAVRAAVAVLLVQGQEDQPPDAAIDATATPTTFVVPAAGTPAPASPPPPPPPPVFPGPIRKDPKHDRPRARVWQKRLVELGYLKAKDVDGKYGDFTGAMTKRLQRAQDLPQTGEVDQSTWRAAFPPQPPAAPSPGPGEVVLALTPDGVVDPSTIGALALGFAGVTLKASAASVLERVHQLAAATVAATTVQVRSFQLAHPENLPPALADMYGLEVQIRRGQRQAITAYLTKEEPNKTVTLTLLIGDLVAGVDPQQPTFDWRRRNLTPAGPGEFSAWESVTGRELFATPVLPG